MKRRPWFLQLQWLILLSMVVGVALGLVANLTGHGQSVADAVDPLGVLFINLLKMIMVPLVFTSIVTGVTGLGDPRRLGRIGLKTVGYYFATTALAVLVGLVLVSIIQPGARQGLSRGDALRAVRQPLPAEAPAGKAGLSVLQAITDQESVDVILADGPQLHRELRFGDLTPFVPLEPGLRQIHIRARGSNGSGALLAELSLRLERDLLWQVVLHGRASHPGGISYSLIAMKPQQDRVWLLHAASGVPSLTVPGVGELASNFDHLELDAPPADGAPLTVQRGATALLELSPERLRSPHGALLAVVGRPLSAQPKELREILIGVVPKNVFDALATDDVLSLIFFALLFGLAIATSGDRGRPLGTFMESAFDVVMRLTDWIMWVAPLGMMALIAKTVAEMGPEVLGRLLTYVLTVLAGLAVHAFITLPLILFLLGRTSPWRYAKAVSRALLTAFSTSSSSATLPVTLECTEKNAGVSNEIGSFVLPLGATVNMDGTALYEAVAALFIAQLYQIDLSFAEQVVIFVTATLAAIGAAGVPSAGLVTMVLVLRAVGLPEDGIGLVVAVDRVLDMCRTTVNVWGDAIGARIIAGSEGAVSEPGGPSDPAMPAVPDRPAPAPRPSGADEGPPGR